MKIATSVGRSIDTELLCNYFGTLVNHFFKILPMRENEESSLPTYMRSLQVELMGCGELIDKVRLDPSYLTLLSILQYLIDHPASDVADVKREVFRAINICHRLQSLSESEVVL